MLTNALGKITVFMQKRNFGIILGLMLRQYRMKKSLKSSTEESRINYFRVALLRYLVEKLIFNGRGNGLVNTLRFSTKPFITYL